MASSLATRSRKKEAIVEAGIQKSTVQYYMHYFSKFTRYFIELLWLSFYLKMSFQRCARTDKGVSAARQVVSLKISVTLYLHHWMIEINLSEFMNVPSKNRDHWLAHYIHTGKDKVCIRANCGPSGRSLS